MILWICFLVPRKEYIKPSRICTTLLRTISVYSWMVLLYLGARVVAQRKLMLWLEKLLKTCLRASSRQKMACARWVLYSLLVRQFTALECWMSFLKFKSLTILTLKGPSMRITTLFLSLVQYANSWMKQDYHIDVPLCIPFIWMRVWRLWKIIW